MIFSILSSVGLLALALVVNFFAGQYALREASNPVTDIVLSNIPVFHVEKAFIYAPVLLWLLVAWLCFSKPQCISLVLKSVVAVILARSVFITLTHIGPYPERMDVSFSYFSSFVTFGSDLFFSGHTAFPFLMSLLFWKNKLLRFVFIGFSLFFGVLVLLGHVHYTIDVLGAFFITHSIYHICKRLFPEDFKRFEGL